MPFWQSQADLTLLQWFLRACIVFVYLLLLTKLMGQKEIGRFSLFDFIISITFGSIAAGALNSSRTELPGVAVVLATLAGLQILLSIIALKFSRLRRVLEEEPIILIQNGKLLENAMRKCRINLDDLMSRLRQKNYFYLDQVEFAVLEPNGQVTVLPKSQNRAATPADLSLRTQYEGYPTFLIEDGNIINENLRLINLTESWLLDQLKKNNISSPKDVLVAMLDTQGKLYYSLKNAASERIGAQGEPSVV